jgi:alkyl hydroperoxide reductase subunit AhpF
LLININVYSLKQEIKMHEDAHAAEVKELKREITSLENKLSIEKVAIEVEKRKNQTILEQQNSIDEELRYSPSLSIERDSVSSANSIWPTVSV